MSAIVAPRPFMIRNPSRIPAPSIREAPDVNKLTPRFISLTSVPLPNITTTRQWSFPFFGSDASMKQTNPFLELNADCHAPSNDATFGYVGYVVPSEFEMSA